MLIGILTILYSPVVYIIHNVYIAYSGIPRVDELPRHDVNLSNVLIVQLTALNDCMVGNFHGFKVQ